MRVPEPGHGHFAPGDAEAVASRPTVIWVRGDHAAGAAFGHTLIDLEPHASAVVVLDHHGSATYAGKVAQDTECQDLDEWLRLRCRLVRRRGNSR